MIASDSTLGSVAPPPLGLSASSDGPVERRASRKGSIRAPGWAGLRAPGWAWLSRVLLPAVLALLSLTALLALVVPFPGPHDGSQRGVASQGPLLESSSTAPQHGHPSVRAEEVDANDLRLSAADPAPPAALLGGALLEPRSDAEPLLCVGSSATADPTGSPDRQVHSARGPPHV